VVATYAYDAYGNLTTESGSATTPLLFQGQYFDQALGAYDLRARWYDPGSARFLSVDPLVAATETPFGYAGGDPVNESDPLGLSWWDPSWAQTTIHWVVKHHQIIEQVATIAVVGLGTAACVALTDGVCAAALPYIGAISSVALYEEGGGQLTLAGAAQAFAEGGVVGSLSLVCVAACAVAGGILASGVIANGGIGFGQGLWDYAHSSECQTAPGYLEAGAEGAVEGAIPWDGIWRGLSGASDG
jgi:RHS repeat-associated protein